ncbi:MAG: DUF4347 domain-containing protein, partial [Cyanobacteria bacterium CAN_BIN43]|nr:DUF4347 domain-containing protein [Cyanobacteria bacterium CAN_BIN43]
MSDVSRFTTTAAAEVLVVIDSGVADFQLLAESVVNGAALLVLDPHRDGIQQITEAQQHYGSNILHIVSHGAPGCLYLGNTELSLDTLDRYTEQVKRWFETSREAELFLYGCNVAAGDAGEEFLSELHHLTGASLAASTNRTGNAALGGDWQLEVTTGEIKAALAFRPEVMATYGHVLPAPILFSTNGSIITNGSTAKVIDSALTVSGADPLDGATVLIGTNFNSSQDRLGIAGQGGTSGTVNGLTWSYSTTTVLMSITGNATTATYEAALRQVTYYSSGTPTGASRNIRYSLGRNLSNSANGHFYNFVTNPSINWNTAQSAAAGSNYFGLQGYLTTITSASEQAFVAGKLQGEGWMGGSDSAVEGAWRWVTGPEAGQQFWSGLSFGGPVGGRYSNWATGEPNDSPSEDHAHFLGNGQWNDYNAANPSVQGYVVEYGGMSGDPTLQITGSATVDFDTTPPVAPSTPDMTAATDTGISSIDNITNNPQPTFTGTTEAGSTVQIFDGATSLGFAIVTGTTWSFTPAAALPDKVYNVNAKATDAAGNVGSSSTSLSVTIDTSAPAAPAALDLILSSDLGVSGTDNNTSDNTPTITGTTSANSTVELFDGGVSLGFAIVTGTTWSFTPAAALPDKVYNVNAKATDAAGNVGSSST